MGFAPQRRGIFRHLKFKKWPEPMVFCAFWLTKVLRATAACHFSRSELQKSLWTWGVLYFLTCKCASRHSGVPFLDIGTWPAHVVFCVLTCKCAARHSGVPFFDLGTSKISPGMWCFVDFDLKMCFGPQRAIFQILCYLRIRRFSEPTFRTSGTTNHWKTQRFATFLTFGACVSSV